MHGCTHVPRLDIAYSVMRTQAVMSLVSCSARKAGSVVHSIGHRSWELNRFWLSRTVVITDRMILCQLKHHTAMSAKWLQIS